MNKNLWINIVGGLIVAALVAAGGWVWRQSQPPVPKETVIQSPSDGAMAPHKVKVSGTYAESDTNKDLWIVVQPVDSPRFHPQTAPLPKQRNQRWTSVAYIGESKEHNRSDEFIIHLVVAEQAASNHFKNYLADAEEDKWPGLTALPDSALIADSITVTRD